MKKNLIKKVFAVSLSIAMACSLLPAANPVTASAAAPYVSLKTTFKTLKVGQKYKMTLKNNKVSWKIKKVETTAKSIATVYGKTTSSVMIKGKSEGRATIRVHLKTAKRKTHNTKTLRCRVKVVTATPSVDPTTPTKTDATVTTQAELDAALKDTNITKITIKPASAVDFVIGQGTYGNVDLIVDAPQSDVTNSATFKSITVENIKDETFIEKGLGNTFTWNAAKGRFLVEKGASVKALNINKAGKINVQVKEGTIAAINVTAKADINIEGKLAEGAAAIAIHFAATATDATLKTAIKAAVTTLAKIAAVFEKGAEDSTIKLEAAGISVKVTNNTTKAIVVTKNDNTTTSVTAGRTSDVSAVNTTPTNPGGSGSGSSYSKPLPKVEIVTNGAINVTVSGTAVTSETVTNSAVAGSELELEIAALTTTPSGYTVECMINMSTSGWSKTVTRDLVYNGATKVKNISIVGAPIGETITITVSCRVKETASYAAGPWVKSASVEIPLNEGQLTGSNISAE